jgi:hypothetical protein
MAARWTNWPETLLKVPASFIFATLTAHKFFRIFLPTQVFSGMEIHFHSFTGSQFPFAANLGFQPSITEQRSPPAILTSQTKQAR